MPQDVKDIHGSLEALRKTFTLLSDKLKHPPFGANVVLRVTESITSCKGGIEALQSELASYHFRRAQYPFKEKTLQKLKSTVKDLRGDLQLALSALRLDVSTTHYQKLNIMHGKLDHLASTSAAASNEIRKDVAHIRTAHDAQAKCTMDSPTSDIASWLSPFNFEAKQNDVFYRRQADTGRWFLETGAGKTILARSNTRPLLAEVSALLHAYLNKLLDAFIVVDALDECIEKDRNDFVAELRTLPSSLRLLITSRGIPSIESKVGKCSRLQIRATHGDLQLFLDAKPKKHDMLREFIDESAGLKEEIVETILLKANGM
ncbi:MAG: hypothetical protein M1815_005017 [Lichina confinis]|nr:MAG: hypothetical protein M1815_005017 [Lichina confinis]